MLHGPGYEVSDTGTDPCVGLVKALILGHRDIIQNLDTDMRTHNFTYGSCNFKLLIVKYFISYNVFTFQAAEH